MQDRNKIKNWLIKAGFLFLEDDFKKSFDYVIAQNRPFLTLLIKYLGKPAVIKILLWNDKALWLSLKNEALAYQLLSKIFNKKLDLYAGLPRLIKTIKNNAHPYFIREKLEGFPVGNGFKYVGGLDKIKVVKVLNTLFKLTEIPTVYFKLTDYGIDKEKWGEDIFDYLERSLPIKIKKRINLAKVKNLKKAAFKVPLSHGCLAHGDIIPGNIVFKENNVYLIDWEKMFIGSPFYDCASLHAILWPDPELQQEAFKEIMRIYAPLIRERELEFRFFIIYHLIMEYCRNPNLEFIPQKIQEILK